MRAYRQEKVANVVREIVSDVIAHRLNDPRVAPLTTVTRVEMTGDLLIAKVYLSVYEGPAVERRTLAAMRHATGYIQRIVAGNLSARQCPELRFELDPSVKIARQTMELLEENRRKQPEMFAPGSLEGSDPEGEGESKRQTPKGVGE